MDKIIPVALMVAAVAFCAIGFVQGPAEFDQVQAAYKQTQEVVADALSSFANCREKNSQLALTDMLVANSALLQAWNELKDEVRPVWAIGTGYYAVRTQLARAVEYAERVHAICDKQSA